MWEVVFGKSGEFKQVVKAFDLAGHTSGVYDFAFSADTSRMATVSKDGTYRFYDIKSSVQYYLFMKPWNLNNEYNKVSLFSRIRKGGRSTPLDDWNLGQYNCGKLGFITECGSPGDRARIVYILLFYHYRYFGHHYTRHFCR